MSRRMISGLLVLVMVLLMFSSQAFASSGLLRLGSRGSAVADLQKKLNSLGYNAGKADGIFGSQTRSAVMAFQKANGLAVDGIVGPATWAKLNGSSSAANSSKSTESKPADSKSESSSRGSSPITQTLRQGSRGSQVKILQERLNSLGYNAGKADGIFGSKTRSAVMAFQKANGLAVDGIVGPATIAKLNQSKSQPKTEDSKSKDSKPADPKPSNPPATSKPPITQTLRQGSRGNQVKILQERLNALGYNAGKADGIFGSKTRSAVMAFQRANGLAVDGIVGPATIAKLYPPTSQPKEEKPKEEKPKEEKPKEEKPKEEKPKTEEPKTEEPKTEEPKTGFKEFKPKAGELAGKIIIIDAGHGGSDPGAVWNGNQEKVFNLDMALRLERMLKQAGATVIMTRTTDTYYSLFYRSAFVNNYIVDQELKYQQGQKKVLADQSQAEKAKLAAKNVELTNASNELTGYRNDLTTKKQQLEDLRKKQDIEKIKAELPNMQSQYDTKLNLSNVLKDDIPMAESLEKEISDLNDEIADLREQLEDINPEAPDYEELYNELSGKLEEAQAALTTKNQALQDIIAKYKEIYEEIYGKEYKVENSEELKELAGELEQVIATLEAEISSNQSIVKDFDTLTAAIQKLEKETIPQAVNKVAKLENEIASLNAAISKLNADISAVDAQISDLNRKANLLGNILKNRNSNSRTGIYIPSSTAGGNVVNKDLKEIFDLTRAKYEDNIIFISIHCNASAGKTTSASGVQVYYRGNSSSSSDSVNRNYYKNYNEQKRIKLANALLKHTRENTNFKGKWTNPFIGDFHVLREHNLPSALMEIGFVNNPEDVKLLNQAQTREDAAKGMYLGIVEYFKN